MKTTLLYLSFLLISISTYSLGAEQPDPVRDTDGEILRSDIKYYIVSVIRGGGGGGVTLARTRNQTCPLDVVQERFDLRRGLPFTFTPVNPENGVIREATDLNIKYSGKTICGQPTVWKLDNYDGENIVTTGGVEGNPGCGTLSNWFRIEKSAFQIDYTYKIVFCPNVCSVCGRPICGDIGISFKNDARRLALSNAPFNVIFVKAVDEGPELGII